MVMPLPLSSRSSAALCGELSALAQAKASTDRSARSSPSSQTTQYVFAYDDETISELERAIGQAAGVEPADGDS